jgi:signal transduction histidine kinase
MSGADREDKPDSGAQRPRTVPLSRGLSTKLLLLTVLFVMLAEVLIFMPSVANFRVSWLQERLSTAAAVGLVLIESEPDTLSQTIQDDVLMAIGAQAIAVRDEGASRLLVVSEMPAAIDEHIDLQAVTPVAAMLDAIDTLLFGGNRMLRAFGAVAESDKEFEIIIPDTGLRDAMLIFARNIAILSLIISLITASLVFYAITRIMIRPIRAMTQAMLSFAEAPEDPRRVIRPADRDDEIGVAERQLAEMQRDLQKTLAERRHLADLGLAVSKINHDMRNMLTSAQLVSDRLRGVQDETVQRLAPKLVRALDRAISYSQGVLNYGRTQEAAPARRVIRLRALVDEVFELIELATPPDAELVNAVDEGFEVDADADQLFRVLANLARNSVQAMARPGERDIVVRRLTISATREGSVARIVVEDTGPGLPKKARENLFAAFRGSTRSGGTGLGLAIASELARAHGGSLELLESRGGRTAFQLTIPDQPVRLDEARGKLRRPA